MDRSIGRRYIERERRERDDRTTAGGKLLLREKTKMDSERLRCEMARKRR